MNYLFLCPNVCFLKLGTINRLIVTETYFWRLIVAESQTINMDSLLPNEMVDPLFTVSLENM